MSIDRPLPVPDASTAPYWEGARAGVLRVPRCRDCGRSHMYPRSACPFCGSGELGWTDCSGRGELHSFTVVHRAPSPAFADKVPYAVAIVALDEGPLLMSNVTGSPPADLRIGQRLQVKFEPVSDGISLPVFEVVR